ncbi:30S ribosomal protein S8 [Candidatus Bathyarchaeota archaeon]|nr:30S ribosomal protein S8 [Candidatus Bathyarchaeota archaeon]
MDTIANGLVTIMNNEIRRKKECIIAPASKLLGNVLRVIQMNGFIGEFEFIDDGRSGKFRVQLLGRINKCGAVRPRYAIKTKDIEKWEKTFLPSRDIGILALSTHKGVMSHKEAMQKNLGGLLLAYVY